MLVNIMGD